jgi:hypothetical protein
MNWRVIYIAPLAIGFVSLMALDEFLAWLTNDKGVRMWF